jgi:hypothetical protein
MEMQFLGRIDIDERGRFAACRWHAHQRRAAIGEDDPTI